MYDSYAGTYFNEDYNSSYIIARKGSKLVGQPWENGPETELIPQSELHFLAPGWPLSVSFVKDKDGRVTQVKEDSDIGRVFKKVK